MKIVLLFGALGCGGTEKTMFWMAKELKKRGHNVRVAFLTATDTMLEKTEYNPIDIISENNHYDGVRGLFKRRKALLEYIDSFCPDLVCAFSIKALIYLVSHKIHREYKVIGLERSNPYRKEFGKGEGIRKRLFSRFADGYCFQTKGARSFYPISVQRKCRVIENAVISDFSNYECPVYPHSVSNKISTAGRLIESKGYESLIDAFCMFNSKIPGYQLHFYGDGPYRETLINKVHGMELENVVFFDGNVDDIYKYISDSRMFVFSSRHEGMPNSLLEAMAIGLPCISTDCQFGPSELIQDGINGLLVPVDDRKKMCEAMIKLEESQELSKSIAKEAAKKRFTNSSDTIIQQYEEYFNMIVKAR